MKEIDKSKKTVIFTQSYNDIIFLKSLLGSKITKNLYFSPTINDHLIYFDNLIYFVNLKFNSFIVLGGHIKNNKNKIKNVEKYKNLIFLPTEKSPEQKEKNKNIVDEFKKTFVDLYNNYRESDI